MNKYCSLKTTAVLIFMFCFIFNFSLKAINIHPYNSAPDTIKKDSLSLILRDCIDLTALGEFIFPIPGKVISHYGKRGNQNHPGTDIKLCHGDTVLAAFQGIVTRASKYYGYGNLVVLNHGQNTETYYAHLSKILVEPGDTITEGSVVGLGGRTGRATCDHLHFEVRVKGKTYNPEMLFDFNNHQVLTNVIQLHQDQKISKHKSKKERLMAATMNPTPSTITTSTTKEIPEVYTIRKNDSLSSLAKRYGTTIKNLCEINGIKTTTTLRIGEKIKVNQL